MSELTVPGLSLVIIIFVSFLFGFFTCAIATMSKISDQQGKQS